MPQGLTTPNWYNDDTYIKDKVAECNVIRFGDAEQLPWTAESVRSFLAAANGEEDYQPWMGYDNFVSNGNAENCSPNPLFNVMEYVTAKANQLNAMNDDAGYEGNNAWTAESVLRYFNDHHITAWDHFTTAGQFENVNPSNAMDLSDFLDKKAAQCNAMEFDGRSDWTPEAVLDYYRDNNINAVQVAVNASDPNVVAVPADEAVTVPAGETPWGTPTLTDVQLTTGQDIVDDGGMPTNFIADIDNSSAKSTLNHDDQITGGNSADELTVSMNRLWTGFDDNGFVKDVPTINLNNESATGRDLSFNAHNIEGADTYNIDGNISLSNLSEAGITVNLANVDTSNVIDLGFNADAVKGADDTLTIGLDNVHASGIGSNGIENIIINATGESSGAPLKYLAGSKSLTINGDADVSFGNVAPTIRTVDMSEATGDNFVCTRRADLIESVTMGQGNDTVSLRSIVPNAVIIGGDGDDTAKLVSTAGAYQLQMDGVETIAVNVTTNFADQVPALGQPDPSASLALDGGLTTGLETLALGGGNGYGLNNGPIQDARAISLTNFDQGELTVKATGKNNVDLNITDIEDITVNVGDGKANASADYLTGTITLPDAINVAINITDLNNPGSPVSKEFNGAIVAQNAGSLSLSTGQYAGMTITGGDLSAVSDLTVTGYYDATITGANLSQDVKNVYVDAQGQVGGALTTSFTGNTTGGATLNYQGSTTGVNNLTVDDTYTMVTVETGVNSDTITLNAGDGYKYTQQNLSGNLGGGNDTVIVQGTVEAGSDFTGLTGVETIKFAGMSTQDAQKYVEDNNIKTGSATVAGSYIALNYVDIKAGDSGEQYGLGGDQIFQGVINTKQDMTLNGNTADDEAGKLIAAFGSGEDKLDVQSVQNLTLNGGTLGADITGTIADSKVQGDLTIDNTASTVADAIGAAGTALSIGAVGNVTVTGNDVAASVFNLKVTQGATATIDAGASNDAKVDVSGVSGNVDITTGAGDDTITAAAPTAGALSIDGGAGDDTISLSGFGSDPAEGQSLTIKGGDGTADTVTFTDNTDLTNWGNNIFTNIEMVQYDTTLTLNANQLGGAKIASSDSSTQLTINDNVTTNLDLSKVDDGATQVTMSTGAKVTLGDATDTIVLGSGVDTADALNVEISGFNVASDSISFATDGFLNGFDYGVSADAEVSYNGFTTSAGSNGDSGATGGTANEVTWSYSVDTDAGGNSISVTADQTVSFDALGTDNKIYALDDGITATGSAGIASLFQDSAYTVFHYTDTSGGTKIDFTITDDGTANGLYLADGSDAVLAVNNGTGTNLWYVSNGATAGTDDLSVSLIGTIDSITDPTTLSGVFA